MDFGVGFSELLNAYMKEWTVEAYEKSFRIMEEVTIFI